MPSQPLDTGWDFSPVIDLIDSGSEDIRSPALRPATQPPSSALQDGGVRLGSFSKLFETLGFSDIPAAPLPPLDPDSELSTSDDALLPSPTFQPKQTSVEHVEVPVEQPTDTLELTKTQRKKARRRAEKEQMEEQTRQRVMQETLDQLADEREQREHQYQQLPLRKQLDEIAKASTKVTDAVETPCRSSRTNSRSNVGAKIRPTTPIHKLPSKAVETPQTQQKQPKTPKARPSILKRPSTAQPTTPPQPQQAPVIVPSTAPAPNQVQYTTSSTPAPPQPLIFEAQRPSLATTPIHHGLVPRTVRPVAVPRAVSQNSIAPQPPTTPTPHANSFSGRRPPLVIRSKTERHVHLYNKLMNTFPEDQKWLVSPMQLLNERSSAHGLHVFVDASNIMIGLKDMLRYHGLHHNAYDVSFDSLALLMERRRPVAKRFFAGSHREANPLPHIEKMVETSKAVGYDSVMQEQVLIVREDSEKKKFFNDVKKMGWHKATQIRSGSGSDSETSAPAPKTPSAPKWVEQGVDEILHLKMCQSIIDAEEPSTMVLATGDGAVAEMSDGFLAHVERALKRGWKVELISWGQQINGGYRKRQFRAKWAEQFTIIELDEFLEDIIDTS
ncbi:hypothetical protein DDE82_005307 [Stemphylium lycopersici]|uniref:NYN domain-containing protein n=1 Tax=Stemphylium lycopersici TaxID=183478 RepID=A0A364N893_STELY|nr:hypothetical protein TW65_02016 [Stemphylium lycopersici]RAR03294.1 hypothetical protein DDE82_005307 [Stemphylium lycopersici]RAR13486.1 hypothetical protein DDE83_003082 [Stemphylium lycopersici]